MAWLLGVRFDTYVLHHGVQTLDAVELEHHLLRSLWHLHQQPPLFNAFLGVGARWSPLPPQWTFGLLYLAMGAALVAVVHRLLLDLRVHRAVAVAATVVITTSPATILYENNLSYEYPLMLGIAVLALAASRWASTGELRWLVTFFAVAGAGVLSRSLLHPLWYLALIPVMLLARPPRGRWLPAAAAIAVPLVLIGAVTVKNQVVFGQAQLSTLQWWNLSRLTVDELPADTRERLIAEGTLTPLARVGSLHGLEDYAAVSAPCVPRHPDVPTLARPYKENGGVNLNAECYLALSGEMQHNALAAARAEPLFTARTVVGSFQVWGLPASDFFTLYPNRAHIIDWDTVFRRVVLLDVPYDTPVKTQAAWWVVFTNADPRWRLSLTIVAATLAALVAGTRSTRRMVRRLRLPGGHVVDADLIGTDAALAVIGVTVAVTTVIGNVFDIGENNRFRVLVEPVVLVTLVWFAERAARRARQWWIERRSTADPRGDTTVISRGAAPEDGDERDHVVVA